MEAPFHVEIRRGGVVESVHSGAAAVVSADGRIVDGWGDVTTPVLPRSAAKPIQALPLVESGAAAGLSSGRLALACASHAGGAIHTAAVAGWLTDLGLEEEALRCGAQMPRDAEAYKAMLCGGGLPGQIHNNCSGKHTGFLMLAQRLGGGAEYLDPDHPVQRAVLAAWSETCGEEPATSVIDGCSALNHATSLTGLARAMAGFAGAAAGEGEGARPEAQRRLVAAMMRHPELVAGEGRSCTVLMRAARGRAAVKTGAEGVYAAILPGRGLGIALKIADGAGRAAEAAIAALLVRYGALDAEDPAVRLFDRAPIANWRGIVTGDIRTVL